MSTPALTSCIAICLAAVMSFSCLVVVPLDCIEFARVAAWSARQLVGACHIREYLGGVCILGGDFVLEVVYDCVEFLPSARCTVSRSAALARRRL